MKQLFIVVMIFGIFMIAGAFFHDDLSMHFFAWSTLLLGLGGYIHRCISTDPRW